MAAPNLDLERAAKVLVDACFMTDSQAAKRHGISRRTVINYRQRLETEPELAQLFTLKLKEAREVEGWADNLTLVIRKAMSAVMECCDELNKSNPETLKALTSALQVLVDAQLTLDVVNARLAEQNRTDAPAPGKGLAQTTGLA